MSAPVRLVSDPALLRQAAELVITTQSSSASQLMFKLSLRGRPGEKRAQQLLTDLEALGIVGRWEGDRTERRMLVQRWDLTEALARLDAA